MDTCNNQQIFDRKASFQFFPQIYFGMLVGMQKRKSENWLNGIKRQKCGHSQFTNI